MSMSTDTEIIILKQQVRSLQEGHDNLLKMIETLMDIDESLGTRINICHDRMDKIHARLMLLEVSHEHS